MRELMQKALSALAQRKSTGSEARLRTSAINVQVKPQSEAWGMSPEDALRVGTVAHYK